MMDSGFSWAWLIALLAAAPNSIISTIKLRKIFMGGKQQDLKQEPNFLILLSIAGLFFISCLGFYENFQLKNSLENDQVELSKFTTIKGYGINQKRLFAEVDTSPLKRFKDKYRVGLIFRVNDASVNYKMDRTISKSYLIDIPDKQKIEISPGEEFFSRMLSPPKSVGLYMVLIPKNLTMEQIGCLSDVETKGGQIFAERSVLGFSIQKKSGEEKSAQKIN